MTATYIAIALAVILVWFFSAGTSLMVYDSLIKRISKLEDAVESLRKKNK